jgi:hypothetical protein
MISYAMLASLTICQINIVTTLKMDFGKDGVDLSIVG